jgi:hypothetical protein
MTYNRLDKVQGQGEPYRTSTWATSEVYIAPSRIERHSTSKTGKRTGTPRFTTMGKHLKGRVRSATTVPRQPIRISATVVGEAEQSAETSTAEEPAPTEAGDAPADTAASGAPVGAGSRTETETETNSESESAATADPSAGTATGPAPETETEAAAGEGVGIPRQQSAEEAADSAADDSART